MYNVMYKDGDYLMSDLVRKQFYITRSQDRQLKEKAKEYGMSEAELVRKALDLQISKISLPREPAAVWKKEVEFIKELMGKGTVRGQRNWKRDDLYDV